MVDRVGGGQLLPSGAGSRRRSRSAGARWRLVQTGCVVAIRRLLPGNFPDLVPPDASDPPATRADWLAAIARGVRRDTPEARYAIALGIAAGSADLAASVFALPNGYWMAMTVLLVLRRGVQETLVRGLVRMAGTLLGAGLATIAAVLRPSPPVLILLIGITAWGAYALQWVNYGAFSICITSYHRPPAVPRRPAGNRGRRTSRAGDADWRNARHGHDRGVAGHAGFIAMMLAGVCRPALPGAPA